MGTVGSGIKIPISWHDNTSPMGSGVSSTGHDTRIPGKTDLFRHSLGLSEMALFTDIPGFSAENSADRPLQRMDRLFPEQHRYRGNLAYQSGHYEDAVAAYERFATALPDVAQPYCLIGDTLAALGRFEDADSAYTKAMENLDRPVYPDPQTAGVRETMARLMSRVLYFQTS